MGSELLSYFSPKLKNKRNKHLLDLLVVISMPTSTNTNFLLVPKIIQTNCTRLKERKKAVLMNWRVTKRNKRPREYTGIPETTKVCKLCYTILNVSKTCSYSTYITLQRNFLQPFLLVICLQRNKIAEIFI